VGGGDWCGKRGLVANLDLRVRRRALYCAWLVGIPPEAVDQLDRIEAAASS
jgi:hypothetical protein